MMRTSLRRSCDACAKAKHSCDLQTPRCSRCIKRKSPCVYANQPLGSSSENASATQLVWSSRHIPHNSPASAEDGVVISRYQKPESSVNLLDPANASFDPFDSYPPTRLPRANVQQLIHHCEWASSPENNTKFFN